MSKTLNNPKAFARQDEAESPAITAPQITDGADFPHTGLIKTLNQGIIGNYATSGFNATGVTATQATFADGVVFRQGKKISVTGSQQTIGASIINGYHLLVNATGTTTLTLRSPTGADLVPAYTADDVIIAVLVHTGNNPMQIQYLTFNKTENSLSIAHDNSNATYTEAGTIQVTGTGVDFTTSHGHLTIQNTVDDGEIRIKGKKSVGNIIIDAVTFDMDDERAVFGGSIISTGSVTAQSKVLTKNTITNNGNNRILTATTIADEHNAEANATFDGSTLAITGSYTATGGVDAALAVNAGTSLSATTTVLAGGIITSNQGFKANGFYSANYETLDVGQGLTQPTGNVSYIFIGDITPNGPHAPTGLLSLTLPPTGQTGGRILNFKNLSAANVVLLATAGENIESTATHPVPHTTGSTTITPAAGGNPTYITLAPLQTIALMSIGGNEAPVPPPYVHSTYYIVSAMS